MRVIEVFEGMEIPGVGRFNLRLVIDNERLWLESKSATEGEWFRHSEWLRGGIRNPPKEEINQIWFGAHHDTSYQVGHCNVTKILRYTESDGSLWFAVYHGVKIGLKLNSLAVVGITYKLDPNTKEG